MTACRFVNVNVDIDDVARRQIVAQEASGLLKKATGKTWEGL
jgi:hypothetical protein